MPPRTIDNLGVQVSTDYAKSRESYVYDEALVKDSREIPSQTQVDVTSPFFPSEVETLLHTQPTHQTWGSIPAPEGYFEQRGRLFTSQIIPSLNPDKIESLIQKLDSVSVMQKSGG